MGLRSIWFRPELMQGDPSAPDASEVVAAVYEMGAGEGTATFTAGNDGATSMYLSNGGASINQGAHPAGAAAALTFVGCAGSYVLRFPQVSQVPQPPRQGCDIHIITKSGLRTKHFANPEDLKEREYEPLNAAIDLLGNTTMAVEPPKLKAAGPLRMIAQVRPDGGTLLFCSPVPVPYLLTTAQLARVLAVGRGGKATLEVDVEPGDAQLQEAALAEVDRAGYARAAKPASAPKRLTGTTTLHWATMYGRLDVVRDTVARGANLEERDSDGYTPLLRAACYFRMAIVKSLLDAGADGKAKDPKGSTALHFSVQSGDMDAVTRLLDAGCDINAAGEKGLTPLAVARFVKDARMESFLKAHGAR